MPFLTSWYSFLEPNVIVRICFSKNTTDMQNNSFFFKLVFVALLIAAGLTGWSLPLDSALPPSYEECAPFKICHAALCCPLPSYRKCNMMWSLVELKMEKLDFYCNVGHGALQILTVRWMTDFSQRGCSSTRRGFLLSSFLSWLPLQTPKYINFYNVPLKTKV